MTDRKKIYELCEPKLFRQYDSCTVNNVNAVHLVSSAYLKRRQLLFRTQSVYLNCVSNAHEFWSLKLFTLWTWASFGQTRYPCMLTGRNPLYPMWWNILTTPWNICNIYNDTFKAFAIAYESMGHGQENLQITCLPGEVSNKTVV